MRQTQLNTTPARYFIKMKYSKCFLPDHQWRRAMHLAMMKASYWLITFWAKTIIWRITGNSLHRRGYQLKTALRCLLSKHLKSRTVLKKCKKRLNWNLTFNKINAWGRETLKHLKSNSKDRNNLLSKLKNRGYLLLRKSFCLKISKFGLKILKLLTCTKLMLSLPRASSLTNWANGLRIVSIHALSMWLMTNWHSKLKSSLSSSITTPTILSSNGRMQQLTVSYLTRWKLYLQNVKI